MAFKKYVLSDIDDAPTKPSSYKFKAIFYFSFLFQTKFVTQQKTKKGEKLLHPNPVHGYRVVVAS